MDIKKAKHIHFIGIGGIGTSSIAQILNKHGKIISGSDSTPSSITKKIKLNGIKISIGHKASNVTKKHQLIIYSPAIPKNNVELLKAKELKIKTISYPEALGELTKKYFTIAITGSHGKSTTTAMMSIILEKAGLDPNVVIGTKIPQFKNNNFRIGGTKYLIIEACEYKRSFLNFSPKILIITNIEADHLDYYKDLEDYISAFKNFVKKVPKDGTVILNANDKNSLSIEKGIKAKIIKFKNLKEIPFKIKLKISGKFNTENAALASLAALDLKIKKEKIKKALSLFKGTWRRMEYKKKRLGKCIFIDDYGHHPTEIKMTLSAIREMYQQKNILCIFQPHQYSRTRLLLKDFGEAFYDVDEVIIPNIYRVRDSEEEVKKISTDDLVAEINRNSKNAKNGNGLKETANFIKKNHSKYDIIVTMGAGDIDSIYKMF